jgi:predicted DNA-binding antitoxin AbrB/MazE fold protein
MQEIEVMGAINEQGQLMLLQPLNLSKHDKVRVRITLLDEEFDPEADSKAQILTDLKESFRQAEAGQTFPISQLWDGIDV